MRTTTRRPKLKTVMSATTIAAALVSTGCVTAAASASTGASPLTKFQASSSPRFTAAAKTNGSTAAMPSTLTACNNLTADGANDAIASTSGQFEFGVAPGEAATVQVAHFPSAGANSYQYYTSWVAFNATVSNNDDTTVAFYCNGDLAARAQSGALIWQSNTAGKGGKTLTINNSGNLVITNAAGGVVWQSGSRADGMQANSVLPSGQYLHYTQISSNGKGSYDASLSMYTNGNLAYSINGKTVWQSNTKVPGSHAALTTRGQLLVISPAGKALWSSNNGYGSINTGFDTGEAVIKVANSAQTIIWRVPGTDFTPN